MHAKVIRHHDGRLDLAECQQTAIGRARRRPAFGGVGLRVREDPPVQHALRRLDAGLVGLTQANLFGKSFARELVAVEPGIDRAQPCIAMDLVLDRLMDRLRTYPFCPNLMPTAGLERLSQAEVGVGIEQNQRQRLSSP